MTKLSFSLRRAAVALALLFAACAHAAPAASFDAWSEAFAADWVRQSAEQASLSQYFGQSKFRASHGYRSTTSFPPTLSCFGKQRNVT